MSALVGGGGQTASTRWRGRSLRSSERLAKSLRRAQEKDVACYQEHQRRQKRSPEKVETGHSTRVQDVPVSRDDRCHRIEYIHQTHVRREQIFHPIDNRREKEPRQQ